MSTFQDNHKDFAELVRELQLLRAHNKTFGAGAEQSKLLQFAEGALTLITLERFLRILPSVKAKKDDSLGDLLDKLKANVPGIFDSITSDFEKTKKAVKDLRNCILHGLFEKAAKQAKKKSKEEYFRTVYISEIEQIYKFTDEIAKKFDPATGKPKT